MYSAVIGSWPLQHWHLCKPELHAYCTFLTVLKLFGTTYLDQKKVVQTIAPAPVLRISYLCAAKPGTKSGMSDISNMKLRGH